MSPVMSTSRLRNLLSHIHVALMGAFCFLRIPAEQQHHTTKYSLRTLGDLLAVWLLWVEDVKN